MVKKFTNTLRLHPTLFNLQTNTEEPDRRPRRKKVWSYTKIYRYATVLKRLKCNYFSTHNWKKIDYKYILGLESY